MSAAALALVDAGKLALDDPVARWLPAFTILKSSTAAMMTSNQVGALDVPILPGGNWGWSFGFAVLESPDPQATPQSAGTYRWGDVYGNLFFVDPAQKLTVIVLTNTALAGMAGAFPDALLEAVYGRRTQ